MGDQQRFIAPGERTGIVALKCHRLRHRQFKGAAAAHFHTGKEQMTALYLRQYQLVHGHIFHLLRRIEPGTYLKREGIAAGDFHLPDAVTVFAPPASGAVCGQEIPSPA